MLEWFEHHYILTSIICFFLLVALLDQLIPRLSAAVGRPIHPQLGKRIFAGLSLALIVLTYFTVIALTALGFKALGRRLLPHPKADPNAETYWRKREKTEPTLEYLKKQF